MNIALVCNPQPENEKTLNVADVVARTLNAKGIMYSLFTTYWPQVWDNFTEAWIIGGDGTLNYFINKYPHFTLPISIFKSGSGNDFHWALYGDVSLEQQIENALKGGEQWVDAGSCNGRLFINGIGIGFDGAIVKDLLGRKKIAGKGSYLLAILKNIVHYKEQQCEIVVNNEKIVQECFMISIANGKRYGGGFQVAPEASLTDGVLDVNIVGKIAAVKRIVYLPVIEKGEHLDLSFVQYRQSNKISISSNELLPAHADGEFFEARLFEIECLPNRFLFRL